MLDLLPDQKAQSTYDNQAAQSQQHHRIGLKQDKACVRLQNAENVESGVAKGGNRMKYTPAQCIPQPIFRKESGKQDQRTYPLNQKTSNQNRLLQPHNAVHIADAQGLGHNQPLLQADSLPKQENQQGSG